MKMSKGLFLVLACFMLLLLSIAKDDSFAACLPPAKIVGYSYSPTSIQDAYDYASTNLALTDFTLQLSGEVFTEDLLLNGGTVVLDGGYDCSFATKLSTTRVFGTITVGSGAVNFAGDVRIVSTSTCAFDVDGDGYTSIGSCLGSADDCNDNDPNTYPGAVEICDGQDNNCDGQVDEGVLPTDADGDGYYAVGSCGNSPYTDDCNDADGTINSGALDIPYDGIDQDCSGADMTFPDVNSGVNCTWCHGAETTWNSLHGLVTAPDTSCATCHAGHVSNILPGHFGDTVLTAGNNMTAGATIECASCHDMDGVTYHTIGGPLGSATNFVWSKVKPVKGSVTCDTCHENRASVHATATAHNNRIIDSSCGSCHTSDTSVLGSPGTGTLISAADVDTLHRSDCTLCHNYTGTLLNAAVVRQVIEQGVTGTQVSCLDCHTDKGVNHGAFEHPVEVGPNDLSYDAPGQLCSDCHVVATWTEIEGTEHNVDTNGAGSCATCHNSPRQEVIDTIALGANPTNCLNCHSDKNLTVHGNVDHVALGYVLGGATTCLNCHDPGTVENATVSVTHMNNCALCHTTVPNLQPGLPVGGGDCVTCHTSDWSALHTIACLSCHDQVQDNQDSIPLNGRRAVASEFPSGATHAHFADPAGLTNTDCLVCHDLNDHSDGIVRLSDADTGSLYEFQVASELTGDPDLSNFCMSCHDEDGATQQALPLDPFTNGNVPPDVATRFMGSLQWNEYYGDSCFGYEGSQRPVNSHHDVSDADQAFSGAKIECLDCHGAHTSAAAQKLTDPFAKNVAWTGTLNQFCLSCHNGEHEPNDPNMPSEVSMSTFYTEPPPEVPGESCGTDMVYDCAGSCVAQTTVDANLADGSCDDLGTPDLDCSVFSFDGDDCRPVNTPNTPCGTDMFWDCADNCVDLVTLIGDPDALPDPIPGALGGTCDEALGLNLNCAEFNYDYNTCNPCIGNDCSSVGGLDSCDYDFAPWHIDAAWQNTPHGSDSKRDWEGYTGAPTVPEMDCVTCHDSHGSYTATNPAGNPYMLRDYVDGTQFIDDGIRTSPGGPPFDTTGTAGSVTIKDFDGASIGPQLADQFCVKCHSNWEAAYSWHSFCSGCLTCHSHGAAWGTNDWGPAPADQTWCP